MSEKEGCVMDEYYEMIEEYLKRDEKLGLVFDDFKEWFNVSIKDIDFVKRINSMPEKNRENFIRALLLKCWVNSAIKCLKNNE